MRRRDWRALVVGSVALGLLLAGPTADAQPTPPLDVDVSGADGHGRIEAPALSCDEGGDGAYWHYSYSSDLPAGPGHGFSNLPGEVRLNLDLHSDEIRFPNTDARPVPANPNAFLLGTETTASLLNDRGTVRLRLSSGGGCGDPTMNFDGVHVATLGDGNEWTLDSGTGAYDGATGTGTFSLTADVAPGADNPFRLELDGALTVLQPNLDVTVLGTFWGNLGVDYLTRRVSVAYRLTNTGPGYAYDAHLMATEPQTSGVTALGPVPQSLGDLLPGEFRDVTVRYQLGLLEPCQLVILGCQFSARLDVEWLDALDVLRTPDQTRGATAPVLPPPL
ncbi:MAG: hypothetical protein ACRD0G_03295 [Acidimicrobiales bacterium]